MVSKSARSSKTNDSPDYRGCRATPYVGMIKLAITAPSDETGGTNFQSKSRFNHNIDGEFQINGKY